MWMKIITAESGSFFDNAGGSLRLKKAEEVFHLIDSMPDASEHSNSIARELAALEDRGREDIKKVIFGAKSGTILSLIDQNTALLCCMAASNISGYIYETEKICRKAREINPDIYIY